MTPIEPTDILRTQHHAIRTELRRLERSLGLLLGTTDRGQTSLEHALDTARVAGAHLRTLIPMHEEQEEFLLTALVGTGASLEAARALDEHNEIDNAYESFLDGLAELDRAPPESNLVRELALSVHDLADKLGRHIRREEERLYTKAEAILTAGEKQAIVARMRISAERAADPVDRYPVSRD